MAAWSLPAPWPPEPSLLARDALVALPLLGFVYAVITLSRRTPHPYVARKVIHVAAGIVALLIPRLFREPYTPIACCALMTVYTLVPHLRHREMTWFQIPGNYGEVYFCVMYGLALALTWRWDIRVGLAAICFMAFGDAATGLTRYYVYRRWTKGAWGTVAMAAVCIPLGWLLLRWAGLVAGVVASLVEKLSTKIDDNLTVPAVSMLVLAILGPP